METHGAPLGLGTLPSLVSVHLVLGPRFPFTANLPDDFYALAVLSCTISVFRSDGVVPLEHAAFSCSNEDRPTIADPPPCRTGYAVPGDQPPYVVRLVDGRTARLLSCLH